MLNFILSLNQIKIFTQMFLVCVLVFHCCSIASAIPLDNNNDNQNLLDSDVSTEEIKNLNFKHNLNKLIMLEKFIHNNNDMQQQQAETEAEEEQVEPIVIKNVFYKKLAKK